MAEDSVPVNEGRKNARSIGDILISGKKDPVESKKELDGINPEDLHKLAADLGVTITENESILNILTDIKAAIRLRVSSIMSPKDMMEVELNYGIEDSAKGDLDSSKVSKFLEKVKDIFDNTYKLKERLDDILYRIMATDGSHPLMVMPYSEVNRLISSGSDKKSEGEIGKEALAAASTSLGFIGEGESNGLYTVSDNYDVLKSTGVRKVLRSDLVRNKIRDQIGLESQSNKPEDKEAVDLYNSIFKAKAFEIEGTVRLSGKVSDNPIDATVIELPAESVIPAGRAGYYVVTAKGRPLRRPKTRSNFELLKKSMDSNGSKIASSVSVTNYEQMKDESRDTDDLYAKLKDSYARFLEQDLSDRIAEGEFGEEIDLTLKDEVVELMFNRALRGKDTQLVFVPDELITYMALDKDECGIGKTLLEDIKILASLRALLTIANVKAAVNNSLNITKVEIEIDEQDPKPFETSQQIMHYVSKSISRSNAMPLSTTNAAHLSSYLAKAGVVFSISSGYNFPQTKVNISNEQSNQTTIDSDLEDRLMRRTHIGIGTPPELIGAIDQVEFATSIVSGSLILAKDAMVKQSIFCPQITDHMRKVLYYSPGLLGEIKEESGLGDEAIATLIDALKVTLPKPDVGSMEQKVDALDIFVKGLDDTLDSFISAETFPTDAFGDEIEFDAIRDMVRAREIRKWCAENNFMTSLTELSKVSTSGHADSTVVEDIISHNDDVATVMIDFAKEMEKLRERVEQRLDPDHTEDDESDELEGDPEPDDDLDDSDDDTPPDDDDPEQPPEDDDTGEGDPDIDFDFNN